jgi:hypothetical protein
MSYEVQTARGEGVDNRRMEIRPDPRILFAERLDNSLIITFDNGKCGLYPAHLLYAVLPQAKDLMALPSLDDE